MESNTKPLLYQYAYLGDITELLTSLKDLAMSEAWDYNNSPNYKPMPILKNYLLHTFARLKDENKVMEVGKHACFNTGLVTSNQQDIYMSFKKGIRGYEFVEFNKESDNSLVKFSPLPERASYFTDPAELIFDYRLPLRINIDHIVEDPINFDRFPKHIQELSKHQLVNTFNGAIEHAKRRIKRNYKTAIPQFYRGKNAPNGQLQLLLPLCLTDPTKADLALTIFKENSDDTQNSFYVGRTCLTLDMAINNARLIAKPDDEWLKP